jgi:hypothetical protein
MDKEIVTSEEEMNAIMNGLKIARNVRLRNKRKICGFKKVDMSTEVIWSAFKAMRDNPTTTIPQAISAGLTEWDI